MIDFAEKKLASHEKIFLIATCGPFKIVGGLKKGHPTEEETRGAVEFYERL